MAHVYILRLANSAYNSEFMGVNEKIEHEIAKRRYPLNGVRRGYSTPISSEIKFYEYRMKEEAIPDFFSDLHPVLLNPTPNNITLMQIFFPHFRGQYNKMNKQARNQLKHNRAESVGKLFLIIQWLFKWANKKKTTSRILLSIALLPFIAVFLLAWLVSASLLLLLLLAIPISIGFMIMRAIVLMNPLKPVPTFPLRARERFVSSYNYNFCFGMLKDPAERDKDGNVLQTDVI